MGPAPLRRWIPLALFLLAFAIRALPRRQVLVGGDVVPFGNDAWYHLRRTLYTAMNFPAVLERDAYLNFPEGGRAIWPHTFDWLLAAALRPFLSPPTPESVERAAVWLPPLLGAATVVALYFGTRRWLGTLGAAVSALVLCFLSGHFWYSQIGFVDHHAAVAWVATALLGAAMALLGAEREGRRGVLPALATGLLLGGALLLWPGALIHVAVVEGALFASLLARDSVSSARAAALRCAGIQLLALALLAPVGWNVEASPWGRDSPVVLGRFQPWLFATLALLAGGCALAWGRPRLGSSRTVRALVMAAGVAGLALASLALLPGLREGAADAWRWLARAERFQASVGESQPLLLRGGRIDLSRASERLSFFFFVYPFALVAAARWAWREPGRRPLLLLLAWSAVLFAACLAQQRFFNTFSVGLAVVFGWTFRQLWQAASGWEPRARAPARALVATGAIAALTPMLPSYAHHVRNELGGPQRVEAAVLAKRDLVAMARWLERHTPETSGWLDASRRPEYGVLAPWPLGHLLVHAARRPAVVGNFGDDLGGENFELAREFYLGDATAGTRLLETLRVRYVIAPTRMTYLDEPPGPTALARALAADGTQTASPAVGDPRALSRYRLVYEVPRVGAADPGEGVLLKVYELVAGARVEGSAPPGSRVRASVALRTNTPRDFVWRATAVASGAGRYRLRVPYGRAHGGASGTAVVLRGPLVLACGDQRAEVALRLSDVREGTTLTGPQLCAD